MRDRCAQLSHFWDFMLVFLTPSATDMKMAHKSTTIPQYLIIKEFMHKEARFPNYIQGNLKIQSLVNEWCSRIIPN